MSEGIYFYNGIRIDTNNCEECLNWFNGESYGCSVHAPLCNQCEEITVGIYCSCNQRQVALFNEVFDLIGGECRYCGCNAFDCDEDCCPDNGVGECIKGTITALYSALVERQYVSEVK